MHIYKISTSVFLGEVGFIDNGTGVHTPLDTNRLPYSLVCFSVSLVRDNQEAGDVAEDGLGEVGHF